MNVVCSTKALTQYVIYIGEVNVSQRQLSAGYKIPYDLLSGIGD